MMPRLLDLFCGAGGAAVGYHRAGFEVVGVDSAPQPNYPFDIIGGDALDVLRRWTDNRYIESFDVIHASPPCQAYTTMNNRHGSSSPPLIHLVRERLIETGLPWVIENVSGALSEMRSPIVLTGEMFGLGVHRPRLFESNWMLMSYPKPHRQQDAMAVYGKQDGRLLWRRADGTELHAPGPGELGEARAAMGIDWMTWDELREAIPPAYTEFLGNQLLDQLARTG